MILQANNLSVGYHQTSICHGISLSIDGGAITSLIGPNGCGKSTLLKALSGQLAPMQGEVTLANKALHTWPPKLLAQRLAFLPQHPSAPENISVQQLVSHGRYPYQGLLSRPSAEDKDIVEWALKATNMLDYRFRDFNQLSGGEKQRAWIALALAQQSQLLLLDEPTTFLDIGHQMEVLELLTELNKTVGLGLIMVLHDVNQACLFSDRLLAMKGGHIVADGRPEQVLTSELMEDLFAVHVDVIPHSNLTHEQAYCIPISSCKSAQARQQNEQNNLCRNRGGMTRLG